MESNIGMLLEKKQKESKDIQHSIVYRIQTGDHPIQTS